MPILLAVGLVIILAVLFGPQLWIRRVLAQQGVERSDLPGTGVELAHHLLDEAGLHDVKVAISDAGDHYDPRTRAVHLTPPHHDGRSIAAVAVAAHEVSHAVQHACGEPGFARRIKLIEQVSWIDRAATAILLFAPVVFLFVHAPILLAAQIGAGVLLLLVRVAVHVATLPVEFDASFNKALPVLEQGRYLAASDLPAARSVLNAAAWTYVGAALATLLDVARLFRVLRV